MSWGNDTIKGVGEILISLFGLVDGLGTWKFEEEDDKDKDEKKFDSAGGLAWKNVFGWEN